MRKVKSIATRRQAMKLANNVMARLHEQEGNRQMLLGAIGALVNKYGKTLIIGAPPTLTLSQEDLEAVRGRKLNVAGHPDGSAVLTLENADGLVKS